MSGEFEFIDMMRRLACGNGARGLADDAAVLTVGNETLVLTHDMMVEGVHWRADGTVDPADVAWKLVAVNLSDLAAKGAEPVALLLGYMLGDDDWDRRFAKGLEAALAEYDAPLLGGDTVGQGEGCARSIGLTAIGRASHVPVPARSGAKAGDALYLLGAIGDAMAGYELGKASPEHPELHRAFHRPTPLLRQGQMLAPYVTAMMDVSDGLLLDAARMAKASDLTVDIDARAIPVSGAFQRWIAILSHESAQEMNRSRLSWGDDYALLFASSEDAQLPFPATKIGQFATRGDAALLIDGKPVDQAIPLGYSH